MTLSDGRQRRETIASVRRMCSLYRRMLANLFVRCVVCAPAAVVMACGSSEGISDASVRDAAIADAGRVDARVVLPPADSMNPVDAQPPDAWTPNCYSTATTLATGPTVPWEIVAHGDRVYWNVRGNADNDYTDGAVLSVSKYGGAVTTIAADQARTLDLAVDATHVYWANGDTYVGGAWSGKGAVMRAPLAGGAPQSLVADAGLVAAIAVDGDNVYFAHDRDLTSGGEDYAILRVPKTGGTPAHVADVPGAVQRLAVDTQHIYLTTFGDGLHRVVKSGGRPARLRNGTLTGLELTPSHVYFIEFLGRFHSYHKATGTHMQTPQQNTQPRRLAIDDQFAYWTNSLGHIARVPLTGGTPTEHIYGATYWGIDVDERCVYWVRQGGEVMTQLK